MEKRKQKKNKSRERRKSKKKIEKKNMDVEEWKKDRSDNLKK